MASDINQLAKKCGVSKATISRVFTGRAPGQRGDPDEGAGRRA